MPFPPFPPPGGRLYVDQHVSHGYFGREPTAKSIAFPSVVYDPNVLQR